jgi:ribosomal protein S25
MSSDIPQVRRNIQFILDNGELSIKEIRSILARTEPLTHREKLKDKKAEPACQKITPQLAYQILDDLAQDPSISTKELAEKYNVNQGRVSDCIKRYGH